MKTTEKISEKRLYFNPTIELIKLDNEISLQLQYSNPPLGHGELVSSSPEYLNNDPFKNSFS